jgi:glutathione S-transferase
MSPHPPLTLVSHPLCPYVQRVAIALSEKGTPFERREVDLAAKPAWFTAISPTGKVPLLQAGDAVLFESAVILEYLEETLPNAMHPAEPLARAEHGGWIEFGSAVLNDIAGLYSAPDEASYLAKAELLHGRFERVEARLGDGPWLAGDRFSLVDAAFGPVFRYFDAFDRILAHGILDGLPRVAAWRAVLSERATVREAVAPNFAHLLAGFLARRGSHLSRLMG